MKKLSVFIILALLIINISGSTTVSQNIEEVKENYIIIEDFDPLVDLNITIDILGIRAFDKIDQFSDPDFFLKVFINDECFKSPTWRDTSCVYNCWTVTTDIPDNIENVAIKIELWDSNLLKNKMCDISSEDNVDDNGYSIDIFYDIKTGIWSGDDYNIGDSSGYGRGCGSGDGSIYKDENDCEIFFNIYQNDYDSDGLPWWIETNVYGTDPTVNNLGQDSDQDGIPIEWEHRWGFNPLIHENHQNIDPDGDSLNNTEEFITSEFGSDPYRKDIFLEIDYMIYENNSAQIEILKKVKEIIKNPYHRRNIIFHLDIGEVDGGDIIPSDNDSSFEDLLNLYQEYFTHNDEQSWKRGIFHYGLIVDYCRPGGFGFSGDVWPNWGYGRGTNCFVISKDLIQRKAELLRKSDEYIITYLFMHEMGHNLGIRFGNPLGCDLPGSGNPLRLSYWLFRNYKSVMNYRYTYFILDYSDGSHGKRDFDDWENIDLTWFEYINSDPVNL
ncbi:MAG: hypothetical protein JSU91_08945 [Thermoplasmatales archaeon]|nr:MAG: hypothetical protein JSU91_08945 [Thermoplasmatales archaeon]